MNTNINGCRNKPAKVIVRFGAASLCGERRGTVELVGGSKDERAAALEWMSLFLHEAAPRLAMGK